jgi:hypothetical protein
VTPAGQVVAGVQPQTPGVPGLPPPQVRPAAQVPQLTTPPQPSGWVPQFAPPVQVVAGLQLHVPNVAASPMLQKVFTPASAHVPQLSVAQPAIPGLNVPQVAPVGHDVGQVLVHAVWVALHVVPAGQAGPQLTRPPQLSADVPQISPPGHDVAFVQPQTPGVPGLPPPQVWLPVQVPQLMVPPQPLGWVPQFCPPVQAVAGLQLQLPNVLASPVLQKVFTPASAHVPQLSVAQPAIPGLKVPQLAPVGHDVGQVLVHAVCVALHAVPAGQAGPQLTRPPQLSETVPQISPAGHDVAFVQPHTLVVPGLPPPQV